MHGNCKCGHHVIAKLLMLLAWVSAILFFVSGSKGLVWNMDVDQYFQLVIVFSLLLFGTKFCGCCWKGKMMSGGMNCACTCGNCEGGKCGNVHGENHQHM